MKRIETQTTGFSIIPRFYSKSWKVVHLDPRPYKSKYGTNYWIQFLFWIWEVTVWNEPTKEEK